MRLSEHAIYCILHCLHNSNPSFCAIIVRQPISNKIIKIGFRTVCFSLIFRAFFDLPVLRHKRETVKN